MSNRRRLPRTGRQGRTARRTPHRPSRRALSTWARRLRGWSALPWLLPALAVAAEAGHLAGAFLEWPGAPGRGAYHVVAAGLLGLVAAAWAGTRRPRPGWAAVAAVVAVSGPVVWLGGALAGAPPYAVLPLPYAAAVTLGELALAAVLLDARATGRAAAAEVNPDQAVTVSRDRTHGDTDSLPANPVPASIPRPRARGTAGRLRSRSR